MIYKILNKVTKKKKKKKKKKKLNILLRKSIPYIILKKIIYLNIYIYFNYNLFAFNFNCLYCTEKKIIGVQIFFKNYMKLIT